MLLNRGSILGAFPHFFFSTTTLLMTPIGI